MEKGDMSVNACGLAFATFVEGVASKYEYNKSDLNCEFVDQYCVLLPGASASQYSRITNK